MLSGPPIKRRFAAQYRGKVADEENYFPARHRPSSAAALVVAVAVARAVKKNEILRRRLPASCPQNFLRVKRPVVYETGLNSWRS